MSQRTKRTKPSRKKQAAAKQLETALASAIQEIGALLETCSNPADLRYASRVLRCLAYIATLQANALQHRVGGSVNKAAQHEQQIERLYAELPAEVKW
jgi:hypothetical protein